MNRLQTMGVLLLTLCLSLPAMALSLDEAKNRLEAAKREGLVGETPSGYLDVVERRGEAGDIVDAINQARRDEYGRIAEKHEIPVTQVETVAGQKAIEKTPSGQYIKADGEWVKK